MSRGREGQEEDLRCRGAWARAFMVLQAKVRTYIDCSPCQVP